MALRLEEEVWVRCCERLAPELDAFNAVISDVPASVGRRLWHAAAMAAILARAEPSSSPDELAAVVLVTLEGVYEQYVAHLRAMPYSEYLKTEAWDITRERAYRLARRRCQICNGAKRLNAHHRTYARRGDERDDDLTVLCELCHRIYHTLERLTRQPQG